MDRMSFGSICFAGITDISLCQQLKLLVSGLHLQGPLEQLNHRSSSFDIFQTKNTTFIIVNINL